MKTSARLPRPVLLSSVLLCTAPTLAYADFVCSPTVSPAVVRVGDPITLEGHCVDTLNTSQPLVSGPEAWTTDNGATAVGSRQAPNGVLTVAAPLQAGTYIYTVVLNGEGPLSAPANVTLTVLPSCNPAPAGRRTTPAGFKYGTATGASTACLESQPSLGDLATPLTGLQTDHLRNQLGLAGSRLRLLRAPRPLATKLAQDDTVPSPWGIYVAGAGDEFRQKPNSLPIDFNARTTALSVGVDYRINDAWVVGGSLGASDSRVAFTNALSDQKSKGQQASVYAGWNLSDSTYLNATVAYEGSKYTLKRDDGTGLVSTSSPRGMGLGMSLSGGHDFVVDAWTFGPYARLDSITSNIDPFDETGSSSAVHVSAQQTRSNTVSLGAQVQLSVPVSWGLVLPFVRLELSQRDNATQSAATATLLSDNSSLLIPTVADTSHTFGTVAVGTSGLMQHGISWFVDYQTSAGQTSYRTQRVSLGVHVGL